MTSWRLVTFAPQGAAAEDSLLAWLHERGCLGAESRNGLVMAYFPAAGSAPHAEALPEGVSLLRSEVMADGHWHERWMLALTPFPIGRRFLVCPGPANTGDTGGRLVIRLTPGRAFGTGEHATTRMCLELMEERIGKGRGLIDVGTGSGILAIAAGLLGAAPVLGIDTDAGAVDLASRNAEANGLTSPLFAAAPTAAIRSARFDTVVANLDGTTILRLMADLTALATSRLILSGILLEEEAGIHAEAASHGMRATARRAEAEWIAVVLERGP